MENHRIRIAKSLLKNNNDHIFIEMEKDSWLEVEKIPTHKAIHAFLKTAEIEKVFPVYLSSRLFSNDAIKNWNEIGTIS
jgi:hypothetical protein